MDVTRERFEELVADAVDGLPEELGNAVDNVAMVVEDWPTRAQLGGRGGTLLGLYEGIPLTHRSPLSYSAVAPDRITIFHGPISERCATEDELITMIRETVIHEYAHHFGISDERLDELGW